MSIELMEMVEKDMVKYHIERLLLLLKVAEDEGAARTAKEIKEIIETAEKFGTIIPF